MNNSRSSSCWQAQTTNVSYMDRQYVGFGTRAAYPVGCGGLNIMLADMPLRMLYRELVDLLEDCTEELVLEYTC